MSETRMGSNVLHQVYSLTSSGEHSEHCSGLFQTQYHLDVGAGERAAELAADWQTIKNDYDEYQRLCVEDKPPENFYSETLQRRGMYYGKVPAHQGRRHPPRPLKHSDLEQAHSSSA